MDPNQLRDNIIEPVLRDMDLLSDSAVQLLMLTCAQESKLGYYIVQVRGPAKGIFQMEPATHDDIWENYLKYKPGLGERLKHIAGTHPLQPTADVMVYNLRYAAAMARVHYRRVSEAIPEHGDITSMANYWKRYYNTMQGRGTSREAIENYYKYVEA